MIDKSPTFNIQQRVDELLQAHVQSQKDAIKSLEQKALHNLIIVNIVAGIIAAFNFPLLADNSRVQLMVGSQREVFGIVFIATLAFVGVCALVAIMSVRVLWVRDLYTHPMEPSRRNISRWSRANQDYFPTLLRDSYLTIYNNNAQILYDKGNMVRWSHRLIALMIISILAASVGLGIYFFAQM